MLLLLFVDQLDLRYVSVNPETSIGLSDIALILDVYVFIRYISVNLETSIGLSI